jgi:hypothetical protein
LKLVDRLALRSALKQRPVAMDDPNGTQKVLRGASLADDRPGSKIPRLTPNGRIGVVGQKDDLRVGANRKQPPRCFESIDVWHGDVEKHNVRAPAHDGILDPVAVVKRSDDVARR